jgi:hypothetical protein
MKEVKKETNSTIIKIAKERIQIYDENDSFWVEKSRIGNIFVVFCMSCAIYLNFAFVIPLDIFPEIIIHLLSFCYLGMAVTYLIRFLTPRKRKEI